MIDAVSAVSKELQSLHRDLSFAACIVEKIRTTSPLFARYYQPYTLPHTTPTHMQDTYHIHQTGARAYLIMHAALHDKELLHRLHDLRDTLLYGAQQRSPLWLACKESPVDCTLRPPCYAVRTVRCCLDAHVLWRSTSCLLDTCNISIHPVLSEFNNVSDQVSSTVSFWCDVAKDVACIENCARFHWVWCRPEEAHAVPCTHSDMMLVLQAEF